MYRPAVELALEIIDGELCLLEDGRGVCAPMTFEMTDQMRFDLEADYAKLDRAIRQSVGVSDYRQRAETLGRDLAAILFGADGAAEPGASLARCLDALPEDGYVRLLLHFDEPELVNLPWELTLWRHPGNGQDICLGRDCRIALSRCRHGEQPIPSKHVFGRDDVLSILNIGADGSRLGKALYARTCGFVSMIDEYIPRLHSASRLGSELKPYWDESVEIAGVPPEIDIIHWRGHGDDGGVEPDMGAQKPTRLSARELYELTGGAFLYVVVACESGGSQTPKGAPPFSFSAALLEAGAAAVLGTHEAIGQEELEYLPIFYPLLFLGVPLDYCIQYLRRFFALVNGTRDHGPHEPWYKLILHATSTHYLDGTPSITPNSALANPLQSVLALCRKFTREQTTRTRDAERHMSKLEAVFKQLQNHELCDQPKENRNV